MSKETPAIYDDYKLNKTQFDSLFTNNVSKETLASLRVSAENGNLNSIDMLHNLALCEDEVGNKAESVLFNLFSGKAKGKVGIDKEIQDTSLRLYKTAYKAKNKENMQKFFSPSRLLYMAGSSSDACQAQKQEISSFFRDEQTSQSQHEQLDGIEEWNIWSDQRKLTSDELETL